MNPSNLALTFAAVSLSLAVLASLATWAVTSRRWRRLLRDAAGRSLEPLLLDQQRLLGDVQHRLAAVQESHAATADRLDRCVQVPGFVRFNAFPEMGSDLSFSLALLDARGTGVVVSSLYGREDSRIYAKPVVEGASTFRLTDEEGEAIRRAWMR